MVKVKALRAHNNPFGDKTEKAEGNEYELPEAMVKTLVDAKLVEVVADPAASGRSKPRAD